MRYVLLQARMSKFNDSSSMWERAKQEHDTSIDKVMKRDWMDNPARQGNRLSPRPVVSSQVLLPLAWDFYCRNSFKGYQNCFLIGEDPSQRHRQPLSAVIERFRHDFRHC